MAELMMAESAVCVFIKRAFNSEKKIIFAAVHSLIFQAQLFAASIY
jgi:hypothetical protein